MRTANRLCLVAIFAVICAFAPGALAYPESGDSVQLFFAGRVKATLRESLYGATTVDTSGISLLFPKYVFPRPTGSSYAVCSPDRRYFARFEQISTAVRLFIRRLDGGSLFNEFVCYGFNPQWADSIRVIYQTAPTDDTTRFVRANILTDAMDTVAAVVNMYYPLSREPEGAALSADGNILAYHKSTPDGVLPYVYNLRTGAEQPALSPWSGCYVNGEYYPSAKISGIHEPTSAFVNRHLCISATGGRLLMAGTVYLDSLGNGSVTRSLVGLFAVDYARSPVRIINLYTPSKGPYTDPPGHYFLSPDGERAVFNAEVDFQQFRVFVAGMTPYSARQLTSGLVLGGADSKRVWGLSPWSPDGKRIVFVDSNALWTIMVDGGDRRRISPPGFLNSVTASEVQWSSATPPRYAIEVKVVEKAAKRQCNLVKLWPAKLYAVIDDDGYARFERRVLEEEETFPDIEEIHLIDTTREEQVRSEPLGKVGFVYKKQQFTAGRSKEVVVVLHNDLVSYRQHPAEKTNDVWAFGNYYNYSYSEPYSMNSILNRVPYKGDHYPTTMLVPPQDRSHSYSLITIQPLRKPVLFIHGVTGRDNYWGGVGDKDKDAGYDYETGSYPARTQRAAWCSDNADVWEYYYPPDQAWRESGYLLARDCKIVYNYYQQPITIVTHSMGGLVSRSYIEGKAATFFAKGDSTGNAIFEGEIDRVLFLGTPHHGSWGGNRGYYEFFVSESVSTYFSDVDTYAPSARDMAVGSLPLTLLNDHILLDNHGVQYLQVSGTSWKGQIPGLFGNPVSTESWDHSDGIVSISGSSLLQYGFDLVLLGAYSHRHLKSPDNDARPLSAEEQDFIPRLADRFIAAGALTVAMKDPDNLATPLIAYIDGKLPEFPAKVLNNVKTDGKDVRLDIAMPVVSLRSAAGGYWPAPRGERRRFELIDQIFDGKSLLHLQMQQVDYSVEYNYNGHYLYYGANNFSENRYKNLYKTYSRAWYAFEDDGLLNPLRIISGKYDQTESEGLGWNIPTDREQSQVVYPFVFSLGMGHTPVTKIGDYSVRTQWCRTTYQDFLISRNLEKMLDANQVFYDNQGKPGRRDKSDQELNVRQDSVKMPVDCHTTAASFLIHTSGATLPDVKLLDPQGNVITPQSADGTTLLYAAEPSVGSQYFTVVSPVVGMWTVRYEQSGNDTVRIIFPMDAENPAALWADSNVTDVNAGIVFRFRLTDTAMRVRNLVAKAAVFDSREKKVGEVLMLDNGIGADSVAGDGIFAGIFLRDTPGRYTVVATMSGESDACQILRNAEAPVIVRGDITGVAETPDGGPGSHIFCRPNPVLSVADIQFDIQEAGEAAVAVYDAFGRKRATLFEGVAAAGNYAVRWNAGEIESGVYYCRVTVAGGSSSALIIRF